MLVEKYILSVEKQRFHCERLWKTDSPTGKTLVGECTGDSRVVLSNAYYVNLLQV